MNAANHATHTTGKQTGYNWKFIGGTGLVLGVLAGIASMFGKDWFSMSVPFAMMIASWLVVNRVEYKRGWSGFYATVLTALVGWAITLAINPQNLIDPALGNPAVSILQLTVAFLLPSILLVGVFGSWVFARSTTRITAVQKRRQQELDKEKNEYLRSKPKRKYKKKK
jgi:ABC-type nickel/cobalt efflux system permease component RcnA